MGGKKGKPYPGEVPVRALTQCERAVTGLGNVMISSTPRGGIIFWRLGMNGKILKTSVKWEIRRALKSYWE